MVNMAQRIERYLLEKNGGNQSEMARFVGVSPQAVQKWVAGIAEPRGKNLELAAEFLGVSQSMLKFGADTNHAPPSEVARPALKQPPHTYLQWITADEADLLSLYRATEEPAKGTLLTVAASLPKIVIKARDKA